MRFGKKNAPNPRNITTIHYFIGALGEEPGGVLFNNRVLLNAYAAQGERVVFHNYYSKSQVSLPNGIEEVGMLDLVVKLMLGRRPTQKIWVHTSSIKRFLPYYLILLPVSIIKGLKINWVVHNGAAYKTNLLYFPNVVIHSLDPGFEERTHSKSCSIYPDFLIALRHYLIRESKELDGEPLSAEQYASLPEKYLMTTGYINETYHFNELIEAFWRNPGDFSLVIVSYGSSKPGAYTDRFREYVRTDTRIFHLRNISRKVYLHLLRDSQALIRATAHDAFGIAMYEAEVFGIPVYASKIENFRPSFSRLFDLGALKTIGLVDLISKAPQSETRELI
jgi:hypothetical protein